MALEPKLKDRIEQQPKQSSVDMRPILLSAIEKHLSHYEQLLKTEPGEDHSVYLEVAKNMINSAEILHADVTEYKKRIEKYNV